MLREHAAQLAREHRQRLLPRRWRRLAPERRCDLVSRNRPSVLGDEIGKEEATLAARELRLVDDAVLELHSDPSDREIFTGKTA